MVQQFQISNNLRLVHLLKKLTGHKTQLNIQGVLYVHVGHNVGFAGLDYGTLLDSGLNNAARYEYLVNDAVRPVFTLN